jgi:hypothetical protein
LQSNTFCNGLCLLLRQTIFMESRYSNDNSLGNKSVKKTRTKKGLTPRELIHYHIENPDEPIKDEDIENLVLQTTGSTYDPNVPVDTNADAADNRVLSDKEIKQAKDNSITTPYDVLGDYD